MHVDALMFSCSCAFFGGSGRACRYAAHGTSQEDTKKRERQGEMGTRSKETKK